MWLSGKLMAPNRKKQEETQADLGVTTIGGEQVAVMARGEVREVPVFSPGGYIWLPEAGETVLLLQGGPGKAENCVAGTRQASPPSDMQSGEVYLFSKGAAVHLKNNGEVVVSAKRVLLQAGEVEITGDLTVNGLIHGDLAEE